MAEQATRGRRTVIDRYQDFRTARFLRHERIWSSALPRWRTRSRRRALVVTLGLTFAFMAAVAVLCATGHRGAALLWLPACVVFFPAWSVLQIVSARRGDAPRGALDEYEIAQRDSARSVGLTLTQNLLLIPVFYLVLGSTYGWGDGADVAYAGALMMLTAMLVGGCAPAMILAWVTPDPDPEEHDAG
ncbi:hypothetical protein [Mycolicibacterium palauense]|uniref:hypothetical protein n=1 Tax=Mycolicibacterium palauense TaxID=2034511 RepID=UPI000BFEF095|nr:hypothetical protein [Mycolicibacterium palauense]